MNHEAVFNLIKMSTSLVALVPVVVDFLNQTSSTKGHSTTQYCDSRL